MMAAEANLPSLEELTAADITLTNVHNTDELDPNLAAYAVCLNAARGEVRVKIKAADSIPRFFALFPSLMDEAVDRQLDLCEDDELKVRHAAIKALPLFVKQRPGFAFKISDVLCQLLQTELSDELDIVETALISCYSHNPVFTAKTIFDQLVSGAIPHIRAKLLKFLLTTLTESMISQPELLITYLNGIELILSKSSGAVVQSLPPWITQENLNTIMRFTTQQVCVSEIALSNDEVGDLILRILCAHIEAVVVFDPSQPTSIDKLSSVIHAGRPIYETRRHRPTAFIRFMLTRVIHPVQFRRFVSDEAKLSALKILAETVEYGVDFEKIVHPFLAGLTFLFKEHRVTERDYSLETNIFPKLECLLYVLYEVQMQNWMQFKPKPETLTHPDLAEYLKQMYINTEKLTGTFAPNNSDGKRSSLYNCFKLVRELLKPFDRRIVRAKFLKEKVLPFSWVVRSVPERGVDAFDGAGARRPVHVSIPQSEIIQSKPSKPHQAIAASLPEVEVIVIDDDDDGPIMETTTGTTTGKRKLSGNQVSKPQPIVWDERKFAGPPRKKGAKKPLNPQQPEVLEQQPEVDIIPEEQMYPQQYQNPPPLQIKNNSQRRKLNLNKRTAAAVAGQVPSVASNIPVRKSIAERLTRTNAIDFSSMPISSQGSQTKLECSCHRKIETKDQGVQTASPLSYDSATMTDLDSEEASRQTGIRVLTPTHLRPAYVEAPEEIRANTLFLPEPAALDNSTVAVYNGSILYREKTKSPAPAATVPRIFPVEHHFQDQSSSLLPSQSIFSQTPNIPHSISIVHAAIERRKSVDQPLPQQFIPPEDFIPVHGDVVFRVADNGRRSDVAGVVEKNGFNRKLQRDKPYYDRKPYSRGYKGPSKEIHIAGVSQQSDGGGSAGGRFVEDRPRSIVGRARGYQYQHQQQQDRLG